MPEDETMSGAPQTETQAKQKRGGKAKGADATPEAASETPEDLATMIQAAHEEQRQAETATPGRRQLKGEAGEAQRTDVLLDNVDVRTFIAEQAAALNKLDDERRALNDRARAIRSEVKARGIKLRAFNAARAYARLDEDQREGEDLSYAITRAAIGLPVQADLFTARPKSGVH